jgi:hypothetical protein
MLLMLNVSLHCLSPRLGAAWECRSKSTAPYGHQHAPPDVAHAQLWSGQELGWQTDLVKNAMVQLHCGDAPTNQHTLQQSPCDSGRW